MELDHVQQVLAAEQRRLDALHRLAVLDTPPEADFDALTRLASRLCDAPIAMVSLVDRERAWFKSKVGTDKPEAPRSLTFCSHAIQLPDRTLMVPDASADPRFEGNPAVAREDGLRMYAGAPLISPDGQAVGTLCVLDHVPRTLTAQQLEDLRTCADQVAHLLSLRHHVQELEVNRHRLVDHQERLARSNAELERFAQLVGHDLKAPLNSISAIAQLVALEHAADLDEEGASLVAELPPLCKRTADLVDALVQYSTVRRVELSVEEVALDDLLDDVLDLLDPMVRERGAQVVRYPLPVVECDAVRVREVLAHLVTNALKYTDRERPTIEIGPRRTATGLATVYVRDDGIGIDPEHFEDIFDMFRRLHGKSAYGGGSGSGLALAATIVERHGGLLEVESTPGDGATFLVTLPGVVDARAAA